MVWLINLICSICGNIKDWYSVIVLDRCGIGDWWTNFKNRLVIAKITRGIKDLNETDEHRIKLAGELNTSISNKQNNISDFVVIKRDGTFDFTTRCPNNGIEKKFSVYIANGKMLIRDSNGKKCPIVDNKLIKDNKINKSN